MASSRWFHWGTKTHGNNLYILKLNIQTYPNLYAISSHVIYKTIQFFFSLVFIFPDIWSVCKKSEFKAGLRRQWDMNITDIQYEPRHTEEKKKICFNIACTTTDPLCHELHLACSKQLVLCFIIIVTVHQMTFFSTGVSCFWMGPSMLVNIISTSREPHTKDMQQYKLTMHDSQIV